MKIKRRFLDKLEEGELDTPDRGIGWRNMLVVNKRTGKRERVYKKVEYHTVWETAFLIGVAGKPMEGANVRKLCRKGKLEGVKFNSIIEDYVSGDAVKLLNTVPWEVPVWALREYFEENGLVDAGREDMPQVPDVAPCPVVAPVRVDRPEVPAGVAPGPVVAPVRADQHQVPVDVAPGSVVAPARAERPEVPAGVTPGPVLAPVRADRPLRVERPQVPDVAPGPVVAPVQAERPQVNAAHRRAAVPVRASERIKLLLIGFLLVVIPGLCCLILSSILILKAR
jgi:hypothetical protein